MHMTNEEILAASTCQLTQRVLHSPMMPWPTSYRPLKSASRGHITVPNWRSKLSTKNKILLFPGLWFHLMSISDVIGTNSCIVKRVATHKARDLPEHVLWLMHHCMLIQGVVALLNESIIPIWAPCEVWCSPTHGGKW